MRSLGVETVGGLFVALASFLFGGIVVTGKTVTNRGVDVSVMLSIRFAVAAVVLAMLLAMTGRPLRAARGEASRLIALGVFGYAVEALFFFFAVERGTATSVTLLFFTYPVLVTLLAIALGLGRPRAIVVGALLAATTGTAIVVGASGDLGISSAGVAFALGSAGMFALYLIGAEVGVRRTASLAAALYVSAAAAVGLGVYALATGGRAPAAFDEWWRIIVMGVFTAGAFFFLFAGLRALGAVRTSIVAALEPLSTTVLAVGFLGETLHASTIGGGMLILAGAVTASVARARRRADLEAPVP